MGQTLFDRIDRAQTATYLFRFGLLGFLIVGFGVLALIIKIKVFPDSAGQGYIIFITRNFVLSATLLATSRYIKRNNTRFAVSFDGSPGRIKLAWLLGFIIVTAAVYELLKRLLLLL